MSAKYAATASYLASGIHFGNYEARRDAIASALVEAERNGMKRAAEIAMRVGNFGDYRREELTDNYGKPRFDLMHDINNKILSKAKEKAT